MAVTVPQGFRLCGVHCGVKRNPEKQDLSLVVSDLPAVAAGVYTQNLVFAASVKLNRARTPGTGFRALSINSGNANACTGQRGDQDCERIAELAAKTCGADAKQALVLSTGVIGVFLPMDKISQGIQEASGKLGSDDAALVSAARGMMTTDTVHKLSGRTLSVGKHTVQITGMAKGAAMIAPNMATMLGVIMTDAEVDAEVAQAALSAAVDQTFNCITVDGHMSTNDTVLLLANGASGAKLAGSDLDRWRTSVAEVCSELAEAIPRDGEGATHLVTIDIEGCASRDAARRIAKAIAESPLVKTAVAGGDPNWGRILSAAGYAGVPFDPAKVTLELNGTLLFADGAPLPFDESGVSRSIKESRDTSVRMTFTEGSHSIRFWTTDLTAEYIRLNADYRT